MQEPKLSLETLHEKLLLLTYIHGYCKGTFILTSGRSSSYYIDGKQVLMTAEGLHAMAMYILISLHRQGLEVEAAGGLTLGADPIAAAVSVLSQTIPFYHPLNCFIVRKEAKKHGTASRIEGPLRKKQRVVIVDDVLTTGSSILSAAAAVEELEAQVSAVYVLVDRREGGREALQQAGYPLEAVMHRLELEQLQQQLESRYPSLFAALQDNNPRWEQVPWRELEARHDYLVKPLKQLGERMGRARKQGLYEEEALKKKAQRILSAIKAAELHPEGQKAAQKILETIAV